MPVGVRLEVILAREGGDTSGGMVGASAEAGRGREDVYPPSKCADVSASYMLTGLGERTI